MEKSFTPKEVDLLIPKLESIFQHIDLCHKRVHELSSTVPKVKTSATDIADAARIQSQVEFLFQAVQEDVDHIGRLGGLVKDIQMGLVDFLARVEGEDAWLCWKRGEEKIHFWHPLYAGYSQRQTLKRAESRPGTMH